jgi:MFS family permease
MITPGDNAETTTIRKSSFSSTTEDDEDAAGSASLPPHRLVVLVTLAVFMGYAALVLLQHRLSQAMHLDGGPTATEKRAAAVFEHGTSFNYIGNLIFRLAHNFVFSCLRPRHRVYISLSFMTLAMGVLGIVVVLGGSHWVGWVYICYFMGGIAIGTFESNLLTSITPLGHATKVWAIVGMPLGFATMSIGGFAFQSLPFVCFSDASLAGLYILVAGLCLCAMLIFAFQIPDRRMQGNSVTLGEVLENAKLWREWFPKLKFLALALALNMFSVSFFSGIMFYIFNDHNWVPLFGSVDHEKTLMNHGWFFTVFNAFTFAGDSISRRVVYRWRPRNPLWYLILSGMGAALCLSRFPIVAPVGIFLVFFANGAIYGTSTRYIDSHIDPKFNLIALSAWLFLGDLGSVTGSNIWQLAKEGFCADNNLKYVCVVASNVTSNVTAVC